MMLFSLALEPLSDAQNVAAWNLYYYLRIDASALQQLNSQSRTLLDLSETASSWVNGKYGGVLHFYNDSTREKVREVWKWYHACSMSTQANGPADQRLRNMLEQTKEFRSIVMGQSKYAPFVRCTLPYGVQKGTNVELLELHDFYRKHGSLPVNGQRMVAAKLANPMLAPGPEATGILHHSVFPLAGFHLAQAYTSRDDADQSTNADRGSWLLKSAQEQFRSWTQAFKSCAQRVKVTVASCDALELCSSMTGGRRAPKTTSSATFQVINLSSMVQYYGSIPLLIQVVPLLERGPESTIYADYNRSDSTTSPAGMSEFLFGEWTTVNLLLGLQSVNFWTNLSLHSSDMMKVNEHLVNERLPNDPLLNNPLLSEHLKALPKMLGIPARLMWKSVDPQHTRLTFEPERLGHLLFRVYTKMFGPNAIFMTADAVRISRAHFVAFIAFLKERHECDWPKAMSWMLAMILDKLSDHPGKKFLEELYAQLHIQGVFSIPAILDPASHISANSLQRWSMSAPELPGILFITIKIPRDCMKTITDQQPEPITLGFPLLRAFLQAKKQPTQATQRSPDNFFADLQIDFGTFQNQNSARGLARDPQFSRDERGWSSQSPMLVSFAVPSSAVLKAPKKTTVGLCVIPHSHDPLEGNPAFRSLPGDDPILFKARLEDREHVAVAESAPSYSSPSSTPTAQNSQTDDNSAALDSPDPLHRDGPAVVLRVGHDEQGAVQTLTARVTLDPGPFLTAFKNGRNVKLSQRSIYSLSVSVEDGGDVQSITQAFPFPVSEAASKIRLARVSGWLEIIAHVHKLSMGSAQDDAFIDYNLDRHVLRSMPYVDLDIQPVISLRNKTTWLDTHLNNQASEKEFAAANRVPSASQFPRFGVKCGVDFFIHSFLGMGNRDRTTAFHIASAGLNGGRRVHFFVFLSELRVDTGTDAAVIDAAIVPATPDSVSLVNKTMDSLEDRDDFPGLEVGLKTLKLWYRLLPLSAERCRKWSHCQDCTWKPIQLGERGQILCDCGRGVFPESYSVDSPFWHLFKPLATRVSISTLFSVPYVNTDYIPDNVPTGP